MRLLWLYISYFIGQPLGFNRFLYICESCFMIYESTQILKKSTQAGTFKSIEVSITTLLFMAHKE